MTVPTLVQMRMSQAKAVLVRQIAAQQNLAIAEWIRRLIDRELEAHEIREGELAQLRVEVARLTKENRLQAEVIDLRKKGR